MATCGIKAKLKALVGRLYVKLREKKKRSIELCEVLLLRNKSTQLTFINMGPTEGSIDLGENVKNSVLHVLCLWCLQLYKCRCQVGIGYLYQDFKTDVGVSKQRIFK